MILKIVFICITCLLQSTYAYVDLFLNPNETNSLFGYPGSLFYLFNGEVRLNSIQHRLEIPDTKSSIQFNWKTTGPLQMLVEYNLTILDQNSSDLTHFLSISSSGFVPSKLESFEINFNCSRRQLNKTKENYMDLVFTVWFKPNSSQSNQYLSSSIDLQLITMPPLNLSIHYRKYCSKKMLTLKSNAPKSTFTVAYFIFAILALFTLTIFLTCIYMYLNNKTKFRKSISATINTSNHSKYESLNKKSNDETRSLRQGQFVKNTKKCRQVNNQSLRIQTNTDNKQTEAEAASSVNQSPNNIYETVTDQSVTIVNEPAPKLPNKSKLALNLTTNTIQSIPNMSMSASRKITNQVELCVKYKLDQIELGLVKMEGTFSKICAGYLKTNNQHQIDSSQYDNCEESSANKQERIRVLIKMVNDYASPEQTELMLKESCAFRGLKHKNVSTVLGLCMDSNNNPMALFNHFEIGNLKMYLLQLKKKRKNYLNDYASTVTPATKNDFEDQPLITSQELLYLILQLLKGVNYLHSKHVVHKDVATRNCWLDANFSLKLADHALSRDMFPQDYHCLADNENKPIHWMSLESLKNNVYNVRSDIWSCGVFMWECFTLAAQPYEHIDPFEFTEYLTMSDLNRLERPSYCPQDIYEVYSKCWSPVPTMRPSLKELFNSIHKFYNSLNNYV